MASEQFCLKWNNFHHNIITAFESLQSTEDLVDVTLSCEGRNVKAHRFILSACSPYFRTLFKSIPNQQHPVIILQNVSHSDLQGVLQFMYQGEVLVTQEGLSTFLKTAELLQVSGLAGSATNRKVNTTQPPESPEVQEIEETILPTTPATDDLISSLSRVKTASPKPPKKQQLDIKLHTEKQEIEPEPIDTIPPQEYQTDLIEPMQSSSSYDPTDSFRVKEETEETHFIEDSMDYSTMSHENTDDSGPAIEEQSILERSLKAQGKSISILPLVYVSDRRKRNLITGIDYEERIPQNDSNTIQYPSRRPINCPYCLKPLKQARSLNSHLNNCKSYMHRNKSN